jgi:hypothetical protein
MDAELVKTLALLAGLEKAWAEYPDDVLAAAKAAATNLDVMKVPTDAAVEPWPPMRAGDGA